MELRIIGSGSSGNAYALVGEKSTLLIECGLPYRDKILPAINYEREKIVGCLVSHEHKDHAGHMQELLADGIDVLMPGSLFDKHRTSIFANVATPDRLVHIGDFKVMPIELKHDVECLGYVIIHQEMGTLLFVTDTEYIPQDLSEIPFSHVMIEANYGEDIVKHIIHQDATLIPHIKHVMKGHLSVESALQYLATLNLTACESISLIHLSNSHSNEKEFLTRAKNAFPKINVFAAKENMIINYNKKPYL